MSPRRTVAELERSLEASRGELASALADLRAGIAEASDLNAQADRYKAQAREHLDGYAAQAREQLDGYRDQARERLAGYGQRDELAVGAVAVGFVAGGGVSGTLQLPVKLVRVSLGLPPTRTRLERAMRQDRYSKQVGRAIAGIAAADRHMRSRRARLWRLLRPTPRRLMMVGSLGGGLYMSVVDEQTRRTIETETVALLQTVGAELEKRIDAIGN